MAEHRMSLQETRIESSMATTAARGRRQRIVGVDAARGLAVVGMIAVHVLPSWSADGQPTLAWTAGSGVAAALFAFLAGVSLSLMTGGTRPQRGRQLHGSRLAAAVRAALLIVLGLILAVFDPPAGIILTYYGVMFLMATPLMGAGPGTLLSLAVVFAVVGGTFLHLSSGHLPTLGGYDPSLTSLLTRPDDTVSALLVTGTYPALAWMTFICAGMAMGRLDLSLRDTQLRLVLGGVVAVAVTWALSVIVMQTLNGYERILYTTRGLTESRLEAAVVWGHAEIGSGWWLFALSPYSETPVELLNVLGWAVAALGALLLLGSASPWVLRPLALMGTMSLTLYSLHLVFISTHLLESVPSVSFWLQAGLGLLFVVLWRNISEWRQGPLEWVLAASAGAVRDRFLQLAPGER